MPTSFLIQVSFASFDLCTGRSILLAADAVNSIHMILVKEVLPNPPLLSVHWAGQRGALAPLRPSPHPRPPEPRAYLFRRQPAAQASRSLTSLSGARPVRPTQTLKGNRTSRSDRGRKGHLSFLCGISKEEAPRRLKTKAGGEVNGEPGFNH